MRWKSLTDSLKLLGCFNTSSHFECSLNDNTFVKRNFDVFEKFFCSLDEKCLTTSDVDEKIIHACYIIRYLYDTAIDAFDKYVLMLKKTANFYYCFFNLCFLKEVNKFYVIYLLKFSFHNFSRPYLLVDFSDGFDDRYI